MGRGTQPEKRGRAGRGRRKRRPGFSTLWKKVFHGVENFSPGPVRHGPEVGGTTSPAGGPARPYFFRGTGGWNFFIQASWTIIMTWLVDQ